MIQVFRGGETIDDVTYGRELGQQVWQENAQLDFSGVVGVSAEFARELCRTVLQRRAMATLQNALVMQTMAQPVQATFFPIMMEAMSGTLTAAREVEPESSATVDDDGNFDVFAGLAAIQASYRRYVETFQQFLNPTIRDWVGERVADGTLLWKDPTIQLSRRFEDGDTFAQMVTNGLLHPATAHCFTVEAGDRTAPAA
jgi:hypothetical protein